MTTQDSSRILVVDDEPDTTDLLEYKLEAAGFKVDVVNDPKKVLGQVREKRPDLIVLDVMMPELGGIQICHTLKADRELSQIPVVFLTARGEPDDRVKGLETGVDDYVAKPFDTRELILRIKAVLKRAAEAKKGVGRTIKVDNMLLDKDMHTITVDQETLLLTLTESKLLQLLMENPDQVVTRETLLARVWNYESDTETRTVDTHVRRLREKLGTASPLLETVRGVGYKLTTSSAG